MHPLGAEEVGRIIGRRPAQVRRWMREGLGGVRLPFVLVGSERRTTREWFERWCADRTEASAAGRKGPSDPAAASTGPAGPAPTTGPLAQRVAAAKRRVARASGVTP